MSRRDGNSASLVIPVPPALKAELEIESWESGQKLTDYVRGLLQRRGKWARSVRLAGHYDIMAPECARRK
jgi:hypothetical protein